MILLIDNYDSFVYNLARYVGQLGYQRMVKRNDKITLDEIQQLRPSHIIISPGPCTPNEAGISLPLIHEFAPTIPILGICLGHQAIGQAFGGKVITAKHPMHGKCSLIQHDGHGIFNNVPSPLKVARYHSLAIRATELPDCLSIQARSADQEIMALKHKRYPTYGLQFHPESVLTQHGYDLLNNFLSFNLTTRHVVEEHTVTT